MKTYTKEQFLNTREPYEDLFKLKKDAFRHEQALAAIEENAHVVGVKKFRAIYNAFLRNQQSGQGSI